MALFLLVGAPAISFALSDTVNPVSIADLRTNASLFSQQYTDGNTAWGADSGSFIVDPNVLSTDAIRFAYVSISAAGGNTTIGNFLDDAHFGVGPGFTTGTPEPSTCITALVGSRRVGRLRPAPAQARA